MSKQREWQKKMREQGRCTQCGKPAQASNRKGQTITARCGDCAEKHAVRCRETLHALGKRTRRNLNAKSYSYGEIL